MKKLEIQHGRSGIDFDHTDISALGTGLTPASPVKVRSGCWSSTTGFPIGVTRISKFLSANNKT
jgi:hypothetical protein